MIEWIFLHAQTDRSHQARQNEFRIGAASQGKNSLSMKAERVKHLMAWRGPGTEPRQGSRGQCPRKLLGFSICKRPRKALLKIIFPLNQPTSTWYRNVPIKWHSSLCKVNFRPSGNCTPGGYLVQKTLRGCAANTGSKNRLLVWMTPYKMQNLVYEWVDFSKVPQIWAKIGSNLRKIWLEESLTNALLGSKVM